MRFAEGRIRCRREDENVGQELRGSLVYVDGLIAALEGGL